MGLHRPFTAACAPSGLAFQPPRAKPTGVLPTLNLAVCPSAACSSSSGTKVPRAVARWAARPSAASAQISGAHARQRQAESQQIEQQGLASMQRSERQGKAFPLCFAHRPNCAFQRTLTRSFASATPYGRR
jgi:hypothetical protein